MTELCEQIDAALGRYYKLNQLDGYFNEKGEGKFQLHCEENGLEADEDIKEDMSQEPSQALLIEFDADLLEDKGAEEVFKIIKECMRDKDAYFDADEKYEALAVTKEDWLITQKDINKTIETHTEQCEKLFSKNMVDDKAILHLIAMSHKMEKPYLQYVADLYSRERIDHIDDDKLFDLSKFVPNNPHCIELKNINLKVATQQNSNKKQTPLEAIQGGIKSYFHRISPELMLTPTNLIVDSLAEVSEWIAATVSFVYGLAATTLGATTCPFQFDATFAFNKVRDHAMQQKSASDNDDDDEDEENDDQNDPNVDAFFDTFGDVKSRLDKNKLVKVQTEIGKQDFSDMDDEKNTGDEMKPRVLSNLRMFQGQFKEFKDKLIKIKKMSEKNAMNYPHKNRFCAFIDRRKPDDADNANKNISDNDELIIYEPPNNCNAFPKGKHVPLFYFNTTRECVIPSYGYNNGDNDEAAKLSDKFSSKDRQLNETISSQSNCNGAIMILSFHIEAADEIKCYLYMKGQVIRFMPTDIINLLPRFFDEEFGDNAKFATSDVAKRLVDEMSRKLKDPKFKAFLKKYKTPKSN